MLKIRLSSDAEQVKIIREGLKARDGYCPCLVAKNADTKCMCKAFRDQTEPGLCHCGLYEKYESEEKQILMFDFS